MPRSAHPSATIVGFGTAKHEETGEDGNALVARHGERAPHNDPHKLTKAAGPLARRRSRLGRLQLHAGTAAAPRSLRITRQSRRLPCRSVVGMVGGLCSLE